jgi:hypothetical membrane protein
MAGTSLSIAAILITAIRYRGKVGERYSPLNHFISELGEVGVSPAAWVFNIGLILSGLAITPFILSLGSSLDSLLGWIGTGCGVVAALGVTAVGIFPMNHLKSHSYAAMAFFRAGLLMVCFFGLAILFQPAERVVVPRLANLFSLLAAAAFASFLFMPVIHKPETPTSDMLDPNVVPERPRFWSLAFLEWLVFFTTILWIFGLALVM